MLGGDGEELDVYLLGVDVPVSDYTGKIIGIVFSFMFVALSVKLIFDINI